MKIKAVTALIVSIIICVFGVFTTMAMGLWTTESTKIPAKFENTDTFDGQYRADDIRGVRLVSEQSA